MSDVQPGTDRCDWCRAIVPIDDLEPVDDLAVCMPCKEACQLPYRIDDGMTGSGG